VIKKHTTGTEVTTAVSTFKKTCTTVYDKNIRIFRTFKKKIVRLCFDFPVIYQAFRFFRKIKKCIPCFFFGKENIEKNLLSPGPSQI